MDKELAIKYERMNVMRQLAYLRKVRALYEESINFLTLGLDRLVFAGEVFKIADYPMLQNKINAVVKRLQPRVEALILKGIKESWNLSNKRNDLFVDARIKGRGISDKAKRIYYNPSKEAYEKFLVRKTDGLNLSDRVWNATKPFAIELEQGLAVGIVEGRPAKEIAKDLKKYLNEPDRLFRRVRDVKDKLVLSKAAKDYHPGQGVYRSSYKNAARLTRTEMNMAYRTADHERWKALPFVTGIEIKLSANHPVRDVCDRLLGKYPKEFKFVGWHVQCICFSVPVMMSDSEYEDLEDKILAGEEITESKNQVEDIPANAKKWLTDKSQMLKGLSNTPYFIRDNQSFVNPYIK